MATGQYLHRASGTYCQPSSLASYHDSAMSTVTIRCQTVIVAEADRVNHEETTSMNEQAGYCRRYCTSQTTGVNGRPFYDGCVGRSTPVSSFGLVVVVALISTMRYYCTMSIQLMANCAINDIHSFNVKDCSIVQSTANMSKLRRLYSEPASIVNLIDVAVCAALRYVVKSNQKAEDHRQNANANDIQR